ncbi:MAG: peptidylprolyl isomerase [Leifsonia sp.]|nr:SurA N-terminal domain-containing protein [Microcella indica]MBR23234.1 peptidylprolyl isomerase [Leifsonia sp.]MBU1251935.1 SurA N-terminal domain-containing protein [Actinomycetota bacterium]MBU1609884.1 SurA N-terminal domain-containing protein [Actinomycetota bacterium]MBU2315981.1 SurA N-terminal domain-containing protein [Actinomycetota bacterium]MBU2385139.1 SurA N-terminal domain-containing protein [Actinomycetota bacterium]
MTRRTTTVWAAGAALCLLGIAGCTMASTDEDTSSADDSSSEQQESGAPDLASIPEVVAEIDGEAISREDFLQAYSSQYAQASLQAQQTGVPVDESALQREVAENLVTVELLEREAEREGIEASEADVDRLAETLAAQNQLGSVEELFDLLAKQGLNEEQAREELTAQATIDAVIATEVGELTFTEDELRELYEAVLAQQEESGAAAEVIPPFEDVRDQLQQQATAQERSLIVEQLVASLRDEVELEFFV